MFIKQIADYVQGRLAEKQVHRFWLQVLKSPDKFRQLEMYLMLRDLFSQE